MESIDELIELDGPPASVVFVELRDHAEARSLKPEPLGIRGGSAKRVATEE
jgi:hypothetical protein